MNTTLIPVRYNTNRNVAVNRLVENNIVVNLENKDDIKSNIDHYLFNEFYIYVLVKFNNTMYICEPISIENREYSRRTINWHPYADKLK
jgi:hypothetical protein